MTWQGPPSGGYYPPPQQPPHGYPHGYPPPQGYYPPPKKGPSAAGIVGIIFAVILALFVGCVVLASLGSKDSSSGKSETKQPKKEEEKTKSPDFTVNAAELVKAYEANEVSADEKYKGKTIRVTGKVHSIDVVLGSPAVKLEPAFTGPTLFDVDKDKAGKLTKGQSVTATCECRGKVIGVVMKECTIE